MVVCPFPTYFTLWIVIYIIDIGGRGDGESGKEKHVTPL